MKKFFNLIWNNKIMRYSVLAIIIIATVLIIREITYSDNKTEQSENKTETVDVSTEDIIVVKCDTIENC